MKQKLLMKTMLAAALLGAGASNAWADEVYDFATWANNGYSITTDGSYSSIPGSSYATSVNNGTFTYSLNNRLVIRFKDSNSRDLWNLRSSYGLYCYRSQNIAFLNLKNGDKIVLTLSGTIKFVSGHLSLNGTGLVADDTFTSDTEYDVTEDGNIHFNATVGSYIQKLKIIPATSKVDAPTLSISSMSATGGLYNPVISISSTAATSYGATFTPDGGTAFSVTITDSKYKFTQAGTLSVYGIAAGSTNSAESKVYLASGVYTLDENNSVDFSDENLVDVSGWESKGRDWGFWTTIDSKSFYTVPETTSFPGVTFNSVSNSSYCPGVGLAFIDNSGGGRTATVTGASAGQISETRRISNNNATNYTSSFGVVKTSYTYSFPKITASGNPAIKGLMLYSPVDANFVGAVDKSSGYRTDFGADITLADGEAKTLTFLNYGTSTQVYYNWLLDISKGNSHATSGDNFIGTLRSDWYAFGVGSYTYAYGHSVDGGDSYPNAGNVWANWASDLSDGATVELTLSYSSGNLYVIGTMTKGTDVYYYNWSLSGLEADNITLTPSVELAYLKITSVVDASVTTTPAKPTTISTTLGTMGNSTFANCIYPLDLSTISGAAAYYAKSIGSETVLFKSTEASVPVGEGLLLVGDAGAAVTINIADEGTKISENLLVGCTESTDLSTNSNYYVLSNNDGTPEFQCLDKQGATIPAGKAYLNSGATDARSLQIVFGDETMGLKAIDNEQLTMGKSVYNLAGQRVATPQKGLYIIDGKKVAVK